MWGFILKEIHFPTVSTGSYRSGHCQRWLVGISVKNANLFSPWDILSGDCRILECLGYLKYLGKHQHNQVGRLCQGDRPKGPLPYTDNSMALKAKVTVCPGPGCILGQQSDYTLPYRGWQVVQTPRPSRGPDKEEARRTRRGTMGRFTSRLPRSQGNSRGFKELAGFGQSNV